MGEDVARRFYIWVRNPEPDPFIDECERKLTALVNEVVAEWRERGG